MAHGVRINPDSFYANSVGLPAAYYQALDTAQSKAVNGDGGGAWNPSSAIAIGGAGIVLACGATISGAGAMVTSSTSLITFGDSDYFGLGATHAGRTQTLVSPIHPCTGVTIYPGAVAETVHQELNYTNPTWMQFPLRVYHGATLTTVVFPFQTRTHSSLPNYFPRFRVSRIGPNGVESMVQPNSSGADGLGFTVVTGATTLSASAWTNSGNQQSFTITCNQNNVIDTSTYAYIAEIIEEYYTAPSSGLPSNYAGAIATFTGVTDLRPQ